MVELAGGICEAQRGLALVPDYWVYTLGEDGHIVGRTEIYCPDDEAALERAKNLADGHAVELWEGARRIALIDGKDGSSTPPAAH
jgi:hypothetical protein